MENCVERFMKSLSGTKDEYAQLYNQLMIMPPDYDPKDPERIEIFAKRLKDSRKSVASRNETVKYWNGHPIEGPRRCIVTTQKDAAKWLGVSEARVSQFESGIISAIPDKYLIEFFRMYGVTPHYLLGYTDDPNKLLGSRDGELCKDENGNYIHVFSPVDYPAMSIKNGERILGGLYWVNIRWFITLCNFLRASDQTLETGFKILDVLLESERKSKPDKG